MFPSLILLFTILPALELIILLRVGAHIGAGNTLFLIILTGITGASLARMQGFSVLRNIKESLNRGQMPTGEMINGVMILVGGIVLLTPGFITDAFGFILLIPWTRELIKYWFRHKIQQMMAGGHIKTIHSPPRNNDHNCEDADYY